MSNSFSDTDLINDLLDEEADTFLEGLFSDNEPLLNRFNCQHADDCNTDCKTCGLFTNCSICKNKDTVLCKCCTLNS